MFTVWIDKVLVENYLVVVVDFGVVYKSVFFWSVRSSETLTTRFRKITISPKLSLPWWNRRAEIERFWKVGVLKPTCWIPVAFQNRFWNVNSMSWIPDSKTIHIQVGKGARMQAAWLNRVNMISFLLWAPRRVQAQLSRYIFYEWLDLLPPRVKNISPSVLIPPIHENYPVLLDGSLMRPGLPSTYQLWEPRFSVLFLGRKWQQCV